MKQTYETPKLTVYGSAEKLTSGVKFYGNSDLGGQAHIVVKQVEPPTGS